MPRPRTGSAFQHGDHWDIRITLPDGTRSNPRCMPASMTEAQARAEAQRLTELAAKLGAVRAGVSKTMTGPAVTIGDVVERWCPLIEAGELAPATRAQHVQLARGPIAQRFGKLAPGELSTPALRVWLRELRVRLSPSRVRHHFFTLSKMLDDADAEGWISEGVNPCRHAKVRAELPRLVAPDDDDKAHHTEQEARALIEATAAPERRLRYAVAFTTGMRDGEIAGLRWCDLNDEKGVRVYRIRGAVARIGDEGWATRRATKTAASKRSVPVHPAVAAMLDAWKAHGWEAYVGRAPKDEDPLFPGPDGKPQRPDSARLLRFDLEAAGLPTAFEGAPFEFRSTRRSFATWLEAHGVSGATIDRLIGHAGASVRRRHYSAGDVEALARAVALITCVGFVSESSEGVTKRSRSVPIRANRGVDPHATRTKKPAIATDSALLKTGAGASLASASARDVRTSDAGLTSLSARGRLLRRRVSRVGRGRGGRFRLGRLGRLRLVRLANFRLILGLGLGAAARGHQERARCDGSKADGCEDLHDLLLRRLESGRRLWGHRKPRADWFPAASSAKARMAACDVIWARAKLASCRSSGANHGASRVDC